MSVDKIEKNSSIMQSLWYPVTLKVARNGIVSWEKFNASSALWNLAEAAGYFNGERWEELLMIAIVLFK